MFKKISALTAITILCSNFSFAEQKLYNGESFDILVGGEFIAELGGRFQKGEYTTKKDSKTGLVGTAGVTANNKNIGIDTAAGVHVTMQNTKDKDFSYGAHIGLKTTTRSGTLAGKCYLERSYIFSQGEKWGRVELGANEGASRAMIIKGKNFDAGEGSWDKYVSLNTYSPEDNYATQLVNEDNFLKSGRLIFKEAKYESNQEAFRKITYYTPKMQGFQFGISYIPDASNRGGPEEVDSPLSLPNGNNTTKAHEKNAISGGISWEKSFRTDRYIAISLVGEVGNLKSAKSASAKPKEIGDFYRSKAFVVGTKYVQDKMSFAASYGNHDKNRFKKNLVTQNGDPITPASTYFYSFGGAYKVCDDASVSLTYIHGQKNKNIMDVVYLGANYKLGKGVLTYGELAHFKGKQKRNYKPDTSVIETGQNHKINGSALITGIKVSF